MKTLTFGTGPQPGKGFDFERQIEPGRQRGGRPGRRRGEAEFATALRRAVQRLKGRFTMAQLVADVKQHEDAKDVSRWINSGELGGHITHWRETGEIELIPGLSPRTFQTTRKWKLSTEN